MMKKLEELIKQAKKGADAIMNHTGEIRVISHYDADGISSAAIMVMALRRAGRNFHLSLVRQVTDSQLKQLAEEKRGFVVFLDGGSGQIDLIRRHLPETDVVIIDHHQQEGSLEGSRIIQVNPMDFGIKEDISGSGATYIVSRAMNQQNRDLAGIAIVGAIGDSQIGSIGEKWGLFGLNREILKDAVDSRKIKVTKGLRIWGRHSRPLHKALEYSVDPFIPSVSGSESNAVQFLGELDIPLKKEDGSWRSLVDLSEEEQKKLASGIIAERVNGGHPNAEWIFGDIYELTDKGSDSRDANEFATVLNACGKMEKGYLGVSLCLNVAKAFLEVKWVLEKYRKSIGSAVRWTFDRIEKKDAERFRKTANAWYFIAGDRINEDIISNVISIVEKSAGPGKPVFAFADSEEGVKVSARASDSLVEKGLNLKKVVSKAASRAGGFGGGHSGASGATIPRGSEEKFISAAEESLSPAGDTQKKGKTNKSNEDEKNINLKENANKPDKTEENYGSAKKESSEEIHGKKMEGQGLVQYFGS